MTHSIKLFFIKIPPKLEQKLNKNGISKNLTGRNLIENVISVNNEEILNEFANLRNRRLALFNITFFKNKILMFNFKNNLTFKLSPPPQF